MEFRTLISTSTTGDIKYVFLSLWSISNVSIPDQFNIAMGGWLSYRAQDREEVWEIQIKYCAVTKITQSFSFKIDIQPT